jgi:hypothetical protein
MDKKNDNAVEKRDVLAELLGSLPAKSNSKLKKIVKAAAAKGGEPKKTPKTVTGALASALKSVVAQGKKESSKKKLSTGRKESTTYQPTQRIVVLQQRECRAGTKAEQCWVLVSKCKTVGDYIAMRKKNGMGDGIGGWFGNFVKNRYISLR